jgi:hypothetical protein
LLGYHCRTIGLALDSCYNLFYHPELSFPDGPLSANVLQRVEGVWEIPVTVAHSPLPEGHHGFKFADCTSLSFPEIRHMLDLAEASGLRHFVIVFHSFSAVKPRDDTFRAMRPNRIVIRRLEKMFEYLASDPLRFTVRGMGTAAAELQSSGEAERIASLPWARSGMRKIIQVMNRPYWMF